MKNKKALAVIGVILLLAGIFMILYPYICQFLYKIQTARVISDYTARMEDYTQPEEEDSLEDPWGWLYDLMARYNRELYESGQVGLVDAFSYQQVDFSLVQFGFDEEMIGYLSVSRMDIELPIYLGASKENMAKGAAHLTQTSLPIGGVNTNAVIAAHRGMSTAAMFRDIEALQIGDAVTITNFRETLYYQVVEIKVINPTDIEEILIQPGRDLVTLITCHPYRHNYQRYLVYCERVS